MNAHACMSSPKAPVIMIVMGNQSPPVTYNRYTYHYVLPLWNKEFIIIIIIIINIIIIIIIIIIHDTILGFLTVSYALQQTHCIPLIL